jgi:hypothetical protein
MRLHFRVMLLFVVIGICGLGVFLVAKLIDAPQIAKANNNSVPEYCIPIELQIINAELSTTSDATTNQILIEKKAALEKSMEECALLATVHPPADKPEELIGVSQPTSLPLPTPKISLGIQSTILLPSGNFIPTGETQNNYWAGVINGQTIQILAGILRDQDETWREDHPEWAEMGPQGAVEVVDSNWVMIALVQTPTRNGYIHIVKECDSLLLLQADDGTMFVFDLANLTFASIDLLNYSSPNGCQ